jgi:hypothetical protein
MYIAVIILSLLIIAGNWIFDGFRKPAAPPAGEMIEYYPLNRPEKEETQEADAAEQPQENGKAKISSKAMVRPSLNGAGAFSAGIQEAPQAPAATAEQDELAQKAKKYYEDPVMQAFNRDLEAALGPMQLEELMISDFHDVFTNNPQIQKILLQYSKDPAFLKIMQEMMSDNAFIKGAAQKAQGKTTAKN